VDKICRFAEQEREGREGNEDNAFFGITNVPIRIVSYGYGKHKAVLDQRRRVAQQAAEQTHHRGQGVSEANKEKHNKDKGHSRVEGSYEYGGMKKRVGLGPVPFGRTSAMQRCSST
jgi:hypothetical protein